MKKKSLKKVPEQLFVDPQNKRTKQFLHAVFDSN